MIRICTRATLRSPLYKPTSCYLRPVYASRRFGASPWRKEDPRISDFGREIIDEFAVMREDYGNMRSSCFLYAVTNME
jgi:triacylglycerol lipase